MGIFYVQALAMTVYSGAVSYCIQRVVTDIYHHHLD